MPKVEITQSLRTYFPQLENRTSEASTLAGILDEIEAENPGFSRYILDDQGIVRANVAVFVDGQMQRRANPKELPISEHSTVMIMQALSGG
jgi:sulfur carrier protein ThiS